MFLITNECIAVASCFVFLETLLCNASLCIISEVFQGYIIMYEIQKRDPDVKVFCCKHFRNYFFAMISVEDSRFQLL